MGTSLWFDLAATLFFIVMAPMWVIATLVTYRKREFAAGRLWLRVVRPRQRVVGIVSLTIVTTLVLAGWIQAFLSDMSVREAAPYLRLSIIWVCVLFGIFSGTWSWHLEFREHGLLSYNFLPWEKIRSYKIVGDRTLHLMVSGYGSLDYRIRPEDMSAVREILEAKLASSVPAREVDTSALVL